MAREEIMVFLLTLGDKLDNLSTTLQEREDMLEALFLESVSWLAIEHATRSFVSVLRNDSKSKGFSITSRLAPGYGKWSLSGQEDIFSLFPKKDIPIRLTSAFCMQPKMSRSGIYGIRSNRNRNNYEQH